MTRPTFAFTSIGLMWTRKATAEPSFAFTSIGLMWSRESFGGTLLRVYTNRLDVAVKSYGG